MNTEFMSSLTFVVVLVGAAYLFRHEWIAFWHGESMAEYYARRLAEAKRKLAKLEAETAREPARGPIDTMVHLYAGRVDRVAAILLGVVAIGLGLDYLAGRDFTVGRVLYHAAIPLLVISIALAVKLRRTRANSEEK